ncbi:MAG: hypothetical protein Q9164_001410 [Protoblastenia rupestris]
MSLSSSYVIHAAAGIRTLQSWYNVSSGLWDSTGWWNGANILTVVADYTAIDPDFSVEAKKVLWNTYTQAQKTNVQYMKTIGPQGMIQSHTGSTIPTDYKDIAPTNFANFTNDYYDDEGWWALAWLKAYDLTNSTQYLETAMAIFEDMTLGWDNTTCGGIWWNKNQTSINAIENELFLSVAAQLANRAPNQQYYLGWALRVWSWFENTGMISLQYNINDGIDLSTCQTNQKAVWSYNQGVILGALVELNKAAPNQSYIDTAVKIANAAVTRLCDTHGVLHDQCEPECGADGSQFKGIFMRNLQVLQQVAPHPIFHQTIVKNADSIWSHDRGIDNKLGLIWSGPYDNKATASTQSSACDALIAAASLKRSTKQLAYGPHAVTPIARFTPIEIA